MQKGDIVGGLGAVGSAIVVYLGYLWNLGFLQLIFSFLAGSLSTYFIQRRLQFEAEERKIAREHSILMRDEVYGPLYQGMSEALKNVMNFQDPRGIYGEKSPLFILGRVTENYLFLLLEKNLRKQVFDLQNDLSDHVKLLSRTENAVIQIAKSELLGTYKQMSDIHPNQIAFDLNDYGWRIKSIELVKAILKRENPLKSFQTDMGDLENPSIEVWIHGNPSNFRVEDLAELSDVFDRIEKIAWKENRLRFYEEKHNELIKELRDILPKLKEKIVTNKPKQRKATTP